MFGDFICLTNMELDSFYVISKKKKSAIPVKKLCLDLNGKIEKNFV